MIWGRRLCRLLVGVVYRNVELGRDVMEWQPIETAPKDGAPHIRGLWVTSSKTGESWWEAICGFIDDDGDFVDHDGNAPWYPEDYNYWLPLPEPPSAPIKALQAAAKVGGE